MIKKLKNMSDTNLLLTITVVVFVVMYLCAVLFLGEGFRKPQTFLNLFNNNASLIIIACGLSLVMITGGIDISVGGVTALVCMTCAVNLDLHRTWHRSCIRSYPGISYRISGHPAVHRYPCRYVLCKRYDDHRSHRPYQRFKQGFQRS